MCIKDFPLTTKSLSCNNKMAAQYNNCLSGSFHVMVSYYWKLRDMKLENLNTVAIW